MSLLNTLGALAEGYTKGTEALDKKRMEEAKLLAEKKRMELEDVQMGLERQKTAAMLAEEGRKAFDHHKKWWEKLPSAIGENLKEQAIPEMTTAISAAAGIPGMPSVGAFQPTAPVPPSPSALPPAALAETAGAGSGLTNDVKSVQNPMDQNWKTSTMSNPLSTALTTGLNSSLDKMTPKFANEFTQEVERDAPLNEELKAQAAEKTREAQRRMAEDRIKAQYERDKEKRVFEHETQVLGVQAANDRARMRMEHSNDQRSQHVAGLQTLLNNPLVDLDSLRKNHPEISDQQINDAKLARGAKIESVVTKRTQAQEKDALRGMDAGAKKMQADVDAEVKKQEAMQDGRSPSRIYMDAAAIVNRRWKSKPHAAIIDSLVLPENVSQKMSALSKFDDLPDDGNF